RVSQLPQLRLRRAIERNANRRCTTPAKDALDVARGSLSGIRVLALDLGKERRFRFGGNDALPRRGRDVEESLVEQLTRDGSRRSRECRRPNGILDRRKCAEHAARRVGDRGEVELYLDEKGERPFTADEDVDEISASRKIGEPVSRR